MTPIWIVHGSTGEYSDRGEWVVDAHRTEDAAKARVKQLDAKLQQSPINRLQADGERYSEAWDAAMRAFRADADGDPRFDHDYTGTRWYVSECVLHD